MMKKLWCSQYFLWRFLLISSVIIYSPLLFSISDLHNQSVKCRDSAINSISSSPKPGSHRLAPYSGDIRLLETSWNELSFDPNPPQMRLNIALFVKKWPAKDMAGGLERHAQTLHRALARRGHVVHVFTAGSMVEDEKEDECMHFHWSDRSEAWGHFQKVNGSLDKGFDIIHTESVCLDHHKARNLCNVVSTWHGIGYEIIHSDILQELSRAPYEPRTPTLDRALRERMVRVVKEIKFFPDYRHHVATSDYVGEVLRTVYMLPLDNVHIILNGVDEARFRPDSDRGRGFRQKYNVPLEAKLVLGMAGRLVKDKGHPLAFRVIQELLATKENEDLYVLIAGNGPWAARYKELGPNVKVLGPLSSAQLGDFYNALDIFVNPTLRTQGLDHTLIEAMLCGKPLLATHFDSIRKSVIVSSEFGYTFSPTIESLKRALQRVVEDGKEVLREKGLACYQRASRLFAAHKMASAYERLFLCISNQCRVDQTLDLCKYPLDSDSFSVTLPRGSVDQ